MQRVIEKILERLRGKRYLNCYEPVNIGYNKAIKDAIEVIQEEAKTGSWVYCSERMPTSDEYIQNDGRFIVTDGMRVYQRHFDPYKYNMFIEPMVSNTLNDLLDYSAVAWQPMPAPPKE